MNLEDKAREYAEGKSSASVFRDAHIRDFKAGYEEGLKDGKLLEMLKEAQEMLYRCQSPATATSRLGDEIGKLIEEYETD